MCWVREAMGAQEWLPDVARDSMMSPALTRSKRGPVGHKRHVAPAPKGEGHVATTLVHRQGLEP